MLFAVFNIILVLTSGLILFDFKKGFVAALCYKMAVPYMVRFDMGPVSINGNDLLLCMLIASFLIHNEINKKSIPSIIKNIVLLYIISTFFLIIFSAEIVPYDYQLMSFFKKFLFQEQLLIVFGFFAFQRFSFKENATAILIVTIICGLYGIFTYFVKANPYVDGISIAYNGSISRFSDFIFEERGSLSGRICGTKTHPLEWGQLWCIIISFSILARKCINNVLLSVVVVIGSINVFLCGSRSALIALAVFLLVYLFIVGLSRRYWVYAFIFIIICGGYVYINKDSQTFSKQSYIMSTIMFWDASYAREASISGSSYNMRQRQLKASFQMISSNPLCGVGYDYQYYTDENDVHEIYGMESIIFKKLIEQGFLGLFIFFLVCAAYFFYVKKLFSSKEESKLLFGYTMSYLVCIIFTGIQGSTWIYYILLQFMVAYDNNLKQVHRKILLNL